jgi:hypothetical protein
VSLVERREFNRWFANSYADADGKFTHIPKWLKADMWEAWQAAGRALLSHPDLSKGGEE